MFTAFLQTTAGINFTLNIRLFHRDYISMVDYAEGKVMLSQIRGFKPITILEHMQTHTHTRTMWLVTLWSWHIFIIYLIPPLLPQSSWTTTPSLQHTQQHLQPVQFLLPVPPFFPRHVITTSRIWGWGMRWEEEGEGGSGSSCGGCRLLTPELLQQA